MHDRARAAYTGLAALCPELTVLAVLCAALHQRVSREHPEAGDAVQWVIVAAIGAAMAVTVGTILYTKFKDKANAITVDTPAPNS